MKMDWKKMQFEMIVAIAVSLILGSYAEMVMPESSLAVIAAVFVAAISCYALTMLLVSMIADWRAHRSFRKLMKRSERHEERKVSSKRQIMEHKALFSSRDAEFEAWMKPFIDGGQDGFEKLRYALLAAGQRGPNAIRIHLFQKVAVPVAFGLICFLAGDTIGAVVLGMKQVMMTERIGMGFAAAFVVSVALRSQLEGRAKERAEQIERKLPDLLDALAIYTRSGLSFEVGLGSLWPRYRKTAPALSQEIELFLNEIAVLSDRNLAYENLLRRVPCSVGIRQFVATLRQSEQTGAPISQALRISADTLRKTAMKTAEKRASMAQMKMMAPQVIVFLPVLLGLICYPMFASIHNVMRSTSSSAAVSGPATAGAKTSVEASK